MISESREAARMAKDALNTRMVNMEMRSTVVTPRRLRSPDNGVIHIWAVPLASLRTLAVPYMSALRPSGVKNMPTLIEYRLLST